MFIHKHVTANQIELTEFPFRRELSMEAYILENESVLSLGAAGFGDVAVIDTEVSIEDGRKDKNTDGRIDMIATYGDEYIAIIELKLGEIQEANIPQIESYLEKKEEIIKKIEFGNEDLDLNQRKWIGILIGKTIEPKLATQIREGKCLTDQEVPLAALTINRFQGNDGQVYIVTDSYAAKVAGKDMSKYLFEGEKHGKGPLVLAVIKSYLKKHPQTTYEQLLANFPDEIQGSSKYGVFRTYEVAQKIFEEEGSGRKRHFINENQLCNVSDGKIAVCNQWKPKNIEKFINRAKELGFIIN